MPSSHLILCFPLLLLPPIPPSMRVFSNESTLRMRWPKYWSFCYSISPSNEHPGLISFRMECLDLLVLTQAYSSPPALPGPFWCTGLVGFSQHWGNLVHLPQPALWGQDWLHPFCPLQEFGSLHFQKQETTTTHFLFRDLLLILGTSSKTCLKGD